jgi:SAM-dependent methyltransferase
VETGGLIHGGELRSGHRHDMYNTAYYGMAPSRLRWVLEEWLADQTHRDIREYSFVDLGCGKGRAVMIASEYNFRQAIGVELHGGLAKIAEDNLAIWRTAGKNLCPVQIVCREATEFVFPAGPCLLYLFHPFTAPVVKRLIERIERAFAGRSGLLDVVYFNPESGDLLDGHSGFTLLWSGTVPLDEEDRVADTVASPEDLCSVYRWVGASAGEPNKEI